MKQANLTRRKVLTALPLVGTSFVAVASPDERSPVMVLYDQWESMTADLDSRDFRTDDEYELASAPRDLIESQLEAEPVLTAQDLAAKFLVNTRFGWLNPDDCLLEELHRLVEPKISL